MQVREHAVSYVNGSQVMVDGLSLRELGYRRGARVRVSDPADAARPAWEFVVANDEHATLVSKHPRPPAWIAPAVFVRIEVTSGDEVEPARVGPAARNRRAPQLLSPAARPTIGVLPEVLRVAAAKTLFDAYLFVDWGSKSGRYLAAEPKDAPWVAEAWWSGEALAWATPSEALFATRRAVIDHARERLRAHVEAKRRVLVGFDFPYGYPSQFASALGFAAPGWRAVWSELRGPTGAGAPRNEYAETSNRNNRFVVAAHLNRRVGIVGGGPLYGCPDRSESAWFRKAKPRFPFGPMQLSEFRAVEARLRARGFNPLSCWWVLGGQAPVVGGQLLTGIPAVDELCADPPLRAVSRVWPFETGFGACPTPDAGPFVVHAEIWPGLQGPRHAAYVASNPSLVRDQAQVRAMIEWAATEDAQGAFGARFDVPHGLDAAERAACEQEEGWILGA